MDPAQNGRIVSIETHDGRWSVEEALALPGNNRYEVVDGALIVVPSPNVGHQRAAYRLHRVLDAAVRDCEVVEAVNVRLADDRTLIPDVLVATGRLDPGANAVEAADVLLAVEIVSPGSAARDRTEKPYLYAQAGIRYFWRVELGHYRGRTLPLPTVVAYYLPEVAADADTEPAYELGSVTGAGDDVCVRLDHGLSRSVVVFDPADLL